MGQRERKSEMERERKGEEAGKEQREYLKVVFVFFFKADVRLLWLCSKQAQLLVPTLSAKA